MFPTESTYGLAVDPRNGQALARLAELKGRDATKAVALVAANMEAAASIGRLGPLEPLAKAFWPGPLTLALPVDATSLWDKRLVGPGHTVAVRVSSHPVARRLAAKAGGLITATSANLSGQPPLCEVPAAHGALMKGLDVVLDHGLLAGGPPSTVVGLKGDHLVIVRPGSLSLAALEAVSPLPVRAP